MTLFEQVSQDIMGAMKARDKEKLDALRNLKKAMLEARTAKGAGAELADDESLKIIQKLVKQGRDAAEIYRQQNRDDLFAEEMAQVKFMESYLPRPLSEEELTAAITAIIVQEGAKSLKDMGRVTGIATGKLAGKAEGKDIAAKVRSLLGQ